MQIHEGNTERPKEAQWEKGTYIYFDYNMMHDQNNNGWCYRLKNQFTFTYDALEADI